LDIVMYVNEVAEEVLRFFRSMGPDHERFVTMTGPQRCL
jgi:hypothetical protein